jgi:hypothetical protein
MADMTEFLSRLKAVNRHSRVLLTVSPVPLTATAEDRHVMVSTMHSKSVLRAVAGELAAQHDFVDYFPSYELVTSPPFRGMLFQNNMRTVHDDGVNFVMRHFFQQHGAMPSSPPPDGDGSDEEFCDEILLEVSRRVRQSPHPNN